MFEPELPPPVWVGMAAALIHRLPAGRYRAIQWLCRQPTPPFLARLPKPLGGYSFACDLRDTISKEVCFTGLYEPQETAIVRALLKPGMSFVDVGANWGYFTLLAAGLVGAQGRVLSLEPDPRLFIRLQENLTRNHLSQVKALRVAAAARVGESVLAGYNEADGNFGISRIVSHSVSTAESFQVETETLDRLLDQKQFGVVDVMKMDIEGAEALALAGLRRSLTQRRIKRLLLELHPEQLAEIGSSVQEVMQLLWQEGYVPMTIDHSPSATRQAAYGRVKYLRQILRPLDPSAALDAWPHQLWSAPEATSVCIP